MYITTNMEQDIDIFAAFDALPELTDESQVSRLFSVPTSVKDVLPNSDHFSTSGLFPVTAGIKDVLPSGNHYSSSLLFPLINCTIEDPSPSDTNFSTSELLPVAVSMESASTDCDSSLKSGKISPASKINETISGCNISSTPVLSVTDSVKQPLPDRNNNTTSPEINAESSSAPETTQTETKRRSSRISNQKYNLRNSSIINRIQTEERQKAPKERKPKTRPQPLSKYRRRTANARERGRMSEINEAFETLAKVVPAYEEDSSRGTQTKITTLRLALNYIAALRETLGYSPDESDAGFSSNSDGCSSPFGASSCDSITQSPRSNLDSEGEQIVH